MEQIGRYQITGELGRGAMGVVYRALDPTIGRTVAIKTIRLADASSDQERQFLRERLFREARSAGILSHPGIVTIYDIQEEDGVCYVFMEYVDGPTLEKLMAADEPLDKRRVLNILTQVGAALDYAHGKGIVHRDIKPGNIMLASSGAVKITDFGIARFTSQQATSTGLLLGTPSYMAPEQIADRALDGRADQFALAVMTYQLLTGERPFTGNTLPSLMFKIVNEDPIPPGRINPTLGTAADIVIRKALSKEAGNRYPNCAAFTRALGNACEARPDWMPMRQGMIASLETVAERVVVPASALDTIAEPSARRSPSLLRKYRTPLAFLAGFGVIAVILFAVMRPSPPVEPVPVAAAPAPPSLPPADDGVKPSAMGPPAAAPVEPPAEVKEARPPMTKSPEPADVPARVVTSPPGAKVIFDGQPRLMCTTPCEMTLSSGRHTLATILDGYRSQQRIFRLPEERELVIPLERAFGTLLVRSTPPGAAIFIDGVERRERTPAQFTLPVGRHKLVIAKEGFKKDEQDIEIKDGVVANIDMTWPR
ncbi:MAG TPA: serine/threonine-protein kinase [Bryobacteraceae bacterium]|nr:serine/threonine-protein kinase [Bryobacteraceae bacterium]